MSLMVCPDCGREVSDRARACVHCGCPLEEAQRDQLLYAVVLRAADYNDPNMIDRIQRATGLSEEKAAEFKGTVPATLKRGLTYCDANELIHSFSANTHLELIHDEDADRPDSAVPIVQSIPKQIKTISFWTIVGAILTAMAIMTGISLILSVFFH